MFSAVKAIARELCRCRGRWSVFEVSVSVPVSVTPVLGVVVVIVNAAVVVVAVAVAVKGDAPFRNLDTSRARHTSPPSPPSPTRLVSPQPASQSARPELV